MSAEFDGPGLEHQLAPPPATIPSPDMNRGALMTENYSPLAHAGTEEEAQAQLARCRMKLEEVAELVARIRHEINNPLTGILGQAQLLLREDLSERARKRALAIEDLALRLRDVVAQLREVQRPATAESKEENQSNNSAG